MTSERTNKILVALVIVLAAMNIATLGTIAYGYLNKQKVTIPNSQNERPMQRDRAERFMERELKLSPEQSEPLERLEMSTTRKAPLMQE